MFDTPLTCIDDPAPPSAGRDGWRLTVGAFLAVEVLAGVLSVVRAVLENGKPETFDLGNYEYYAGFAQLHGFRSPIALPGMLQTYLDAQLNVAYYLLIAHLAPRPAVAAIALLQSLPVSLLAVLVWRLARRTGVSPIASAVAGLLAGVGAFYAPIYGIEIGETASDSLLALPLIAGVALLYRSVALGASRRSGLRDCALGGMLFGIAGALKFTTWPFILASLLGYLFALLAGRSRGGSGVRRCLLMVGLSAAVTAVVASALYLPTALLLWNRYHDPVFPYFNSIFRSPDLLPGTFRDPRWVPRTPMSFWLHYSRLLVGGDNRSNGTSQWPVRSPVMFFGIAVTAVSLVTDLIRREKPEALLLEISLVGGFIFSEAVFGIYRYLAPMEMTTAAVVISVLLLHRVNARVVLPLLAACLALGSLFAVEWRLGSTRAFGSSYFAVPPGAFSELRGAGVIMAGPGPLGYLVPYLPTDADLIRTGGNLDLVMSPRYWARVATDVHERHLQWWVVFQAATLPSVPLALRQIGFSGTFSNCGVVDTDMVNVYVCRLPPPTGRVLSAAPH